MAKALGLIGVSWIWNLTGTNNKKKLINNASHMIQSKGTTLTVSLDYTFPYEADRLILASIYLYKRESFTGLVSWPGRYRNILKNQAKHAAQ